jgi:hypothetical protein
MQDQGAVALFATHGLAAGLAPHCRRPATAIDEQDRLLALLERVLERVHQLLGVQRGATIDARLVAQINDFYRRQRCATYTRGKFEQAIAAFARVVPCLQRGRCAA